MATGTNVITNSAVTSVCPSGASNRPYNVHAYLARDLLPGGSLVYSNRFGIKDPNAILYVEQSDIATLQAGTKAPEPLILRAAAGDCVKVTLTSHLPWVLPESDSWNMMPMIVNRFNFNQVRTSNRIGLHSQLLSSNTYTDDGASVGFNLDSLVAPGGTYRAGEEGIQRLADGQVVATGRNHLVVLECDPALQCAAWLVERATGTRTPVPVESFQQYAWFGYPQYPVLSPDGTAAIVSPKSGTGRS